MEKIYLKTNSTFFIPARRVGLVGNTYIAFPQPHFHYEWLEGKPSEAIWLKACGKDGFAHYIELNHIKFMKVVNVDKTLHNPNCITRNS
jgi:hypothetical protein